jgi:hypothetical protein
MFAATLMTLLPGGTHARVISYGVAPTKMCVSTRFRPLVSLVTLSAMLSLIHI